FAANTISLLRRPGTALASFSYQTVHTTLSSCPVKAMSGSTPARVGSMFRVGSTVVSRSVDWPESRRSSPTCWKQNPFTLFAADDLLGIAQLLLDRRPGDLDVAGDDGATRDVDQAGVLFRVDGVRRVIVDLGAVRRERHEGGGCGGRQYPREHRRETESAEPAFHSRPPCSVRGSDGCVLPLYARAPRTD